MCLLPRCSTAMFDVLNWGPNRTPVSNANKRRTAKGHHESGADSCSKTKVAPRCKPFANPGTMSNANRALPSSVQIECLCQKQNKRWTAKGRRESGADSHFKPRCLPAANNVPILAPCQMKNQDVSSSLPSAKHSNNNNHPNPEMSAAPSQALKQCHGQFGLPGWLLDGTEDCHGHSP